MKLMVSDVPFIKQASNEEYIESVSAHIAKIAKATEGRMLVLFTSYEMLKKKHIRI